MKTSYIYIITDENNFYKVGVTDKDPNLRLKQLQTGHPNKLRLVEIFKVPKQVVYNLEKECHLQLSFKFPKRGEWFKIPNERTSILIVDSVCCDHLLD